MQDWQAVWQLVTSPNGLGLLGMGAILCASFFAAFMRQQRLRWAVSYTHLTLPTK